MNDDIKKAAHAVEECADTVKKITSVLSDEWQSDAGELIVLRADKISLRLAKAADEIMRLSVQKGEKK